MTDAATKAGPTPDADTDMAADSAGQVALLLVESLIHELTASGVIAMAAALRVVHVALDTQIEMDHHNDLVGTSHAVRMLERIAYGLTIDSQGDSQGDSQDRAEPPA